MRQFDVFRTRGAILAALLAIGFSGIGCRGGGMPGGAIETFESGRSALDKGEFAAARVHFSRILDQYPTLVEANKYAAGAWKRSHAPQNVLRWLKRYHTWMCR